MHTIFIKKRKKKDWEDKCQECLPQRKIKNKSIKTNKLYRSFRRLSSKTLSNVSQKLSISLESFWIFFMYSKRLWAEYLSYNRRNLKNKGSGNKPRCNTQKHRLHRITLSPYYLRCTPALLEDSSNSSWVYKFSINIWQEDGYFSFINPCSRWVF